MQKKLVIPAPGARVLDPAMDPPAPLPAVGKMVPWDTYWRRRVRQGDALLGEETKAKKSKG
jgi:hypothetical protein